MLPVKIPSQKVKKRQALLSVDHLHITHQKGHLHGYQLGTDNSEHYCNPLRGAVPTTFFGRAFPAKNLGHTCTYNSLSRKQRMLERVLSSLLDQVENQCRTSTYQGADKSKRENSPHGIHPPQRISKANRQSKVATKYWVRRFSYHMWTQKMMT